MRVAFGSLRTLSGALVLAVTLGSATAGSADDGLDIVDAHGHCSTADAPALSPAELLGKADAAGVSRIPVSGAPTELAQQFEAQAPDRVAAFLGVYESHRDKALWMHDAGLPARVETQLADGNWAGLGELPLFAADAGSPVFERLVRLAEAQELILILHGDAEIIARAFAIAPGVPIPRARLGTNPGPEQLAAVLLGHADRRCGSTPRCATHSSRPAGCSCPSGERCSRPIPDASSSTLSAPGAASATARASPRSAAAAPSCRRHAAHLAGRLHERRGKLG